MSKKSKLLWTKNGRTVWVEIDNVTIKIIRGAIVNDILVRIGDVKPILYGTMSHESGLKVLKAEALKYAETVLQREFKRLLSEKVNPLMNTLNNVRKEL